MTIILSPPHPVTLSPCHALRQPLRPLLITAPNLVPDAGEAHGFLDRVEGLPGLFGCALGSFDQQVIDESPVRLVFRPPLAHGVQEIVERDDQLLFDFHVANSTGAALS